MTQLDEGIIGRASVIQYEKIISRLIYLQLKEVMILHTSMLLFLLKKPIFSFILFEKIIWISKLL